VALAALGRDKLCRPRTYPFGPCVSSALLLRLLPGGCRGRREDQLSGHRANLWAPCESLGTVRISGHRANLWAPCETCCQSTGCIDLDAAVPRPTILLPMPPGVSTPASPTPELLGS
jgi:hypothetical protein